MATFKKTATTAAAVVADAMSHALHASFNICSRCNNNIWASTASSAAVKVARLLARVSQNVTRSHAITAVYTDISVIVDVWHSTV